MRNNLAKRGASIGLLSGLLAGLVSLPATAMLIDDFADSQAAIAFGPGATAYSSQTSATAIGGERDLQSGVINGSGTSNTIVASGETNPFRPADSRNYLSHTQGNNSGYSQVVWDGVDGDASQIQFTGLGGLDLTDAGADNAFHLKIVTSDSGALMAGSTRPGRVTMFVFSDVNRWSYYTFTPQGRSLFDPESQDVYLPYLAFQRGSAPIPQLGNLSAGTTFDMPQITNPATLGADFSNVGSILMVIDGSYTPQFDFGVELLQTTQIAVPPSAWMVAAVTALAWRQRRRKIQPATGAAA